MDSKRLLLGPARPVQGYVSATAAVALAVPALSVIAWALLVGGVCGSYAGARSTLVIVAWVLPAVAAAGAGWALFDAGVLIVGAGAALGLTLTFLAWAYLLFAYCA